MRRALQTPPTGFDEMTVEEKIDYVQALWDRITAKEAEVPVPGWHRVELERRLAEHRADPEAGRSWEEVEADLQRKLGR